MLFNLVFKSKMSESIFESSVPISEAFFCRLDCNFFNSSESAFFSNARFCATLRFSRSLILALSYLECAFRAYFIISWLTVIDAGLRPFMESYTRRSATRDSKKIPETLNKLPDFSLISLIEIYFPDFTDFQ